MMRSVFVVLALFSAAMAQAQSSMVVPLAVKNGTVVQFVEFGYSPYNTFVIDNDTLLGPFSEAPAPPPAPAFALETRFQTIDGRTEGLGFTGTYKDFRDYRNEAQVDSFLLEITGSGPTNGLRINPTVITWPKTLDRYASAWVIQTAYDAVIPPTNMLTADTVVIPAKPGASQQFLLIIKTGAIKASHPKAFKTLAVSDPGFYNFEMPKFAPAVIAQFVASPGAGAMCVERFADGPTDAAFNGTVPAHLSQYRWVISQTGLKNFSANLRFQYGQFTSGITSGSTVTIYRRPKEGTGVFQAMTTSFTQGVSELSTSASEFGEFIFGSNDNPLTEVAKGSELPSSFGLDQNYPNPFNPTTSIRFEMPRSAYARMNVYSILGQEVAKLVDGVMPAGMHVVQFDARSLTSGMYFYRLETERFVETRTMLLVK